MRRYSSETLVGLEANYSQSLRNSHKMIPKSMTGSVVMSEEIPISSKVMAILKKTHDQSQMLKGRLSILRIQEQKNDLKAKMSSKKYEFHHKMREIAELEEQQKAQHLKKIMQRLSKTKQQAQSQRLQHKLNLQQAQHKILSKNMSEYKKSKEQAEEIKNNIISERRYQQSLKKQRVEQIREYKKMQRKNVMDFMQNKKKSIKHVDSAESLQLSTLAEQRKRQIQELAMLESEMLQRQARSKHISDHHENKLKKLLQSRSSSRQSRNTKLPLIKPPKNTIESK